MALTCPKIEPKTSLSSACRVFPRRRSPQATFTRRGSLVTSPGINRAIMTDRWRNIVLQWHATGLRRIPAIMTCQHPGVIHDNHLFQIHEPCSERGGSCGGGRAKRRGVTQIFLSWTSWRVSSNRTFPTTLSCLLHLFLLSPFSFFLSFVRSFVSFRFDRRT